MTAHDVVYSFDAMLSEDNVAPYRSTVRGVTASYRALDDLTFEFTGIDATATLLDNSVGMVPIMPKHIWESVPFAEWTSAPGSTGTDPTQVIGCGPFKFVEWVQGDHATITRNDDYFLPDHVPYLENYTVRIVADSKTAESALVTGESDYGSVNPGDYQSFKDGNPDFTYAEYDQWGWMAIELNADPATGTFFSDTRVRHALLHAADRDAIVENILFGFGTVAHGVQPPPSPAYAPDKVRTIYNYDPEHARALLEEAGWVDTDGDGIREKDGVKFSVDFNYDESFTTTSQIVTYLQQAWKEVGIEVKPATNYVFDDVLAGKTQLAIGGIIWTAPDQGTLYRCDAIPPDGFNLSRHCNEEYDRINTESVYELDPDKRLELLIEQSDVINDDAPWPLLYFTKGATIVQPRVHNFYAAGITAGLWSYNKIWIEQE